MVTVMLRMALPLMIVTCTKVTSDNESSWSAAILGALEIAVLGVARAPSLGAGTATAMPRRVWYSR